MHSIFSELSVTSLHRYFENHGCFLQNLEKQIEAMKERVTEAQARADAVMKERDSLHREVKLLRETNKQFGNQYDDSENMKQDLEAVRRELEHLRTSAQYDCEERQQHVDTIRTLEDFTQQLELDNRELANKV